MHPKLLGALVSELGEDFMFMQHCDVLVNSTTKLGRHSVDRKEDCTGECWDNDAPYSVVRVLAFVEEDEVSLIPDTHLIPGKDEKKAIKVAVPVGSVFIHDARLYTGFPEIEAPRYAVTPFFGLPDKHSKRHHNFITQQRRDLGYNGANPKLHRLLSSTKVLYHD